MKVFRIWFGFIFWITAIVFTVLAPFLFPQNAWIRSLGGVARYIQSERQSVTVDFPYPVYIKRGDPVYFETENGLKRIGQVADGILTRNSYWDPVESAEVVFFGNAPPVTNNCVLVLHETPGNFKWAIDELLPPEKRAEIVGEFREILREILEEHSRDVLPVFQASLKQAGTIIREDLNVAIQARREEISKIASRYQAGFVEQRLIPLVKEEIFPIVEERAQPVLNEVGSEIWKKASLWRFGWRLAYDKFPLTSSNLLGREWNRFVKEDALPVLEGHSQDFYELSRTIIEEIAKNEAVRQAGKDAVNQLLKDEEITRLLSGTLQEVILQNDRLKEMFRKALDDEKMKSMVQTMSFKLENKLREIGDRVFGTFQTGVTREFAGVLRKEILRRDQRWFELSYRDPDQVDQPLESAERIEGYFDIDYKTRPAFVREP